MSTFNQLLRQLPILLVVVVIAYLAGQYMMEKQLRTPENRLKVAREALGEGREELAEQLLRPLAEKGNPQAQYALGHLYSVGLGVKADPKVAEQWTRLAADQGLPEAEQQLGQMYMNGLGEIQDFGMAYEWLDKAGRQGNAAAQRQLGELYQHGWGIDADPVKAFAWYRVAASNGDLKAPHLQDALAQELDSQQISDAQSESTRLQDELRSKSAKAG
jgi:TPR repeat protein